MLLERIVGLVLRLTATNLITCETQPAHGATLKTVTGDVSTRHTTRYEPMRIREASLLPASLRQLAGT